MEIIIFSKSSYVKQFFLTHLLSSHYRLHFLSNIDALVSHKTYLNHCCFIIDFELKHLMQEIDHLAKDISPKKKELWITKIFIIDNLSEKTLQDIVEVGADDYILKPFQKNILQQKISALIDLKRDHFKLLKKNNFLEKLSCQDPLTQLGNRYAFNKYFKNNEENNKKLNQPLSLLLVKIESFDSFNDCYGYHYGDKAIQIISQVIKKIIKTEWKQKTSLITRYAEEEFAILIENTLEEEILVLKSSLLTAIKTTPLPIHYKRHTFLTASIGFCCTLNGLKKQNEILEKARIRSNL